MTLIRHPQIELSERRNSKADSDLNNGNGMQAVTVTDIYKPTQCNKITFSFKIETMLEIVQ